MADALEKLLLALGAGVLVLGLILILVPIGTLLGAIAGWVVGWFFGDTILHVLAQGGLRDISMWQLGAALGFIGGFLRTTVSRGKE